MTQHDKAQDMVERVARAWASIDGKADLFDNDDGCDPTLGYRDGYKAEAEELLARSGLADLITAQAERIKALEEAVKPFAEVTILPTGAVVGLDCYWFERARAALDQGQKEGD